MSEGGGEFDLLVVGGGINGAGIARDAAGRGLRTALVDQGDFGGATSWTSTKLVHGGLRYLEHYEFRLVRESLAEREILMRLAPHLVRPLRFVMPHVPSLRPAWMIRLGLWLYDRLGGRGSLPGSAGVRIAGSPFGAGLRADLGRGFAYSDARVDDARLVIANLLSARELGALLYPRTRLVAAARREGLWRAALEEVGSGRRFELTARVLVNAAGPWVKDVTESTASPVAARVRLVKGSHIVVPRLHAGEHACLLQNVDKRIVFLIPYGGDHTLIGTTEQTIASMADGDAPGAAEVRYLLDAANRYLAVPIDESAVVWSYSGVRPLYDDGRGDPAAITRDYTLVVDDSDGVPELSVFGGKLTTYRKLAETVLGRLAPWLRCRRGPWTDGDALPGGGFAATDYEAERARLGARYPRLPRALLDGVFARHGLDAAKVLGEAREAADLGRDFGGGLCEREAEHCIAREWALDPDDILWRRTKAGLAMTPAQRAGFAAWFAGRAGREAP